MSARFEIVETDAEQGFHVRLVADNGEPISSGENHGDEADARHAVEVEARLFGYDVSGWEPGFLCLIHHTTGTALHLPVKRVDERAGGEG